MINAARNVQEVTRLHDDFLPDVTFVAFVPFLTERLEPRMGDRLVDARFVYPPLLLAGNVDGVYIVSIIMAGKSLPLPPRAIEVGLGLSVYGDLERRGDPS